MEIQNPYFSMRKALRIIGPTLKESVKVPEAGVKLWAQALVSPHRVRRGYNARTGLPPLTSKSRDYSFAKMSERKYI